MKYNAIAFDGKTQISHFTDVVFSKNIEKFISKNEKNNYKVIVDLLDGKKIENVYTTKK